MIHEKFNDIRDWHQKQILDEKVRKNAKEAAVLIILTSVSENEDKVIVIKRNEYEGAHSGQMAFPGGKKDDVDQDLKATALREAEEEIGVNLNNLELIAIEPLWVMVSNFWVQAYFTKVNKKLDFNLNKREINRIFEIPVSFFKDAENIQAHQININNKSYWAPIFKYEEEIIWGATAMLLYELFHLRSEFN
jgi:8-oxo-dGTP pyrophosphatase MutT (NUDIX family)